MVGIVFKSKKRQDFVRVLCLGTKFGARALEHLLDQMRNFIDLPSKTNGATTPDTATLIGLIVRFLGQKWSMGSRGSC